MLFVSCEVLGFCLSCTFKEPEFEASSRGPSEQAIKHQHLFVSDKLQLVGTISGTVRPEYDKLKLIGHLKN